MRNVPMFPAPEPPPVTLSKTLAPHGQAKGSYARYQPKNRVACDECVVVLHEARGVGSAPMRARMTRKSDAGTLRLCSPHAGLWRELDGVKEKR